MSHRTRTILIGLFGAYLVGYFSFWAQAEVDWLPVSAIGLLLIFLILRWLIGRND